MRRPVLAAFHARRLASALCLCLALLPARAQAEDIAHAERLILEGRAPQAIALLASLETTSPQEEARRLWALSIAHVRDARPRAALPYLERLVSLDPANPTYRLELALQLEATAQADRARYHFEIARGADLPPAIAADIAQRIDRIDRNKTWEGFFKFALIPESNAARRTDADTVFIGALPVTLAPSSRPKPAQGVNLGAGIALLPALSQDLRARLGVSVDARLFDGAAPDDVNLRGELGLLSLGDRNRVIGGGLLLGQRWIDSDAYSTSRGGYLSFGQTLGAAARSNLSLTLLHDRTDFERRGLADLDRTILSARLTHLVTPQLQLRIGAQLDHTDSRAAWERAQGAGVTLGARYAFAGGLLLDLEVSAQKNKRDAVDPFFLILREDTRKTARLRVTNRNWSFRGFAPVLELGVERQDSTNAFYDYTNTSALLGFTRQF